MRENKTDKPQEPKPEIEIETPSEEPRPRQVKPPKKSVKPESVSAAPGTVEVEQPETAAPRKRRRIKSHPEVPLGKENGST